MSRRFLRRASEYIYIYIYIVCWYKCYFRLSFFSLFFFLCILYFDLQIQQDRADFERVLVAQKEQQAVEHAKLAQDEVSRACYPFHVLR